MDNVLVWRLSACFILLQVTFGIHQREFKLTAAAVLLWRTRLQTFNSHPFRSAGGRVIPPLRTKVAGLRSNQTTDDRIACSYVKCQWEMCDSSSSRRQSSDTINTPRRHDQLSCAHTEWEETCDVCVCVCVCVTLHQSVWQLNCASI